MVGRVRGRRLAWCLGAGAVALTGCMGRGVTLPAGHRPPVVGPADLRTAGVLDALPRGLTPATPDPAAPKQAPKPDKQPDQPPGKQPFELPAGLPGASAPPIVPPQFAKDTPQAEREKAVRAVYPQVTPAAATELAPPDAPPLALADLQQIAAENSPVVRRAVADVEAAYGQVVQAGLYPNPTAGYQVDQWQPSLRIPPGSTGSGAGQQGGFINQLIKTAGKLGLAQKVAGFDYINALVAVRRARVDVTAAVRTQYFAALVARQGLEVNRALVGLADEVYGLQLKQLAAGVAVGYEPLQLYAQAEQARNALTQSQNAYRAAWKQLSAAVGRPDLPPAPLAGAADAPAPEFAQDGLLARVLEQHTDILTALNTIEQAKANLTLQRRVPIPDIGTNQYHQYDNLAQTYQFGLQFGVSLPVFDRNQGNIRTAEARIGRSVADLAATRNDLTGRLAEAFARYEANRVVAERYREKIIPNLTRAYRALVRRWNVDELGRVQFNDIVVAQQNLAQALQAYLAALDAQWRAVVDLANLGQLDELYPPAPQPPQPDGGGGR